MAFLAASQLLGGVRPLLGQAPKAELSTPKAELGGKPIFRTLGQTGISLPIVSMGVMNADVPGLVKRSYELGIRHFDTAALYQQGRNEMMVGNMIQEMGVRDQVTISTKVIRPGFRFGPRDQAAAPEKAYTPAEIKANFMQVFEGSLKRLQMDHVDILYNHACDTEADVSSEGAIEALIELKKQGKARFMAVSSHQPEMALKTAMKLGVYDVVLIQFNYTMANDESLMKTIDAAAKMGIGIVAMKTQAGGLTRPDPKLGKPRTPASQTALLKWVLRHESVTTAIPGYTTYDQLEQNFSVASDLGYSAEEREFLGDKNFVAEAQFCRQCGQCRPDCPHGVDIPQLMRSHMYTVQYANHSLAAETMAAIEPGKGLSACETCASCTAKCRNSVNISRKIQHLREIASIGRVNA
jgi:aryl-alcohol dehydrogenase-like predicted oxidoreductase/ribosomal protein S14